MELLTRVRDVLWKHRFGWLGQRALDCLGLSQFLCFDLIVCCDYGSDTPLVSSRTGASVISLEQETGIREKWDNFSLERLFEGETLGRLSAAILAQDKPVDIIAYCSTDGLERLAAANECRINVLAARAFLKQFFDNKITLRAVLPALDIEPVPGHVARLGTLRYREMDRAYGMPFVIQFPIGAAGSRTFFISCESELQDLQVHNPAAEVIVSRYIRGMAPNINAVVLDDAILVAYPSIQLIGIGECTNWPAAYCGNDFTATRTLPDVVIQNICEQAQRIGYWLRQHGFRGLFGVDYVLDDSGVYPIEVNPRFQGSTHILTQSQLMYVQVPLTLAHILQFMEGGRETLSAQLRTLCSPPQSLPGAQIILHSKERAQRTVRGVLKPGIYALEGDAIVYRRYGLSLVDCLDQEEFAVTCAVPVPGARVEPEAPLLKIQTLRGILDVENRMLCPWAARACNWAYQALNLQ